MADKGKKKKRVALTKDAMGEGDAEDEGQWMDLQRKKLRAQEYLTYIGEAKDWIEACIEEDLPAITSLEEALRNGVYLAKLAKFYSPSTVKKIYDADQKEPLNLRHSDNFNAYINAAFKVGLPSLFFFELTDLYDQKNMPKVIYMIHALSHYLAKLGIAPKIKKGKYTFTDDELLAAAERLGDTQLPSFGDIGATLAKETNVGPTPQELAEQECNTLQSKYEQDYDELSIWIKATQKQASVVDYKGKSSEEIKNLQSQIGPLRAQLPPKKETIGELERVLGEIKTKRSSNELEPYDETPRTMESLNGAWKSLEDTIDGREKSLQEELQVALAREAEEAAIRAMKDEYEAHSLTLVQWINERTGQWNKAITGSLDEVNQYIAEIETYRKAEKAAKNGERLGVADEYEKVNARTKNFNGEDYVPPTKRSTQEITESWNALEAVENRRMDDLLVKKKKLEEDARSRHFAENEDKVVKIQSFFRGSKQREAYKERLALWKQHTDKWIALQAHIRGWEVRRRMRAMLDHYKEHEDEIIKIQAMWRARQAKKQFDLLMKDKNTPVDTIQRFLHLLDFSDRDFEEELQLEQLKQKVVYQIKDNNDLEKHLNQLDIKIALLVKNRTSLEDVVESTKKYLKKQKRAEGDNAAGLRSLDANARQKLEGYQHLFYLLQTTPSYLAKLIFTLKAQERYQKFIETVILTLYGYAQHAREEYLLLRLIGNAIDLELETVDNSQQLLRENPVFFKMVVHYTRFAKEKLFFRELLNSSVKAVMEWEGLDLDVDPQLIYRQMINDEETRTGEKSKLPSDVTRGKALENDEVMKIFVKRLKDLRSATDRFLKAILGSVNNMPYGLRYIASRMKAALIKKFPNEDKEHILKLVGNLIYYRYINPAIVGPEGFDVVEGVISPAQRKNLAEIAKMLHQISVNKLFEDDLFYLSALNDFISKSKEKFYAFFEEVCNVPSPEEYFQIDNYSDLTKTTKPFVYISAEELYSTHALIAENIDSLATAAEDPLRIILNELGQPPELNISNDKGQEMSLTLINRFAEVKGGELEKTKLYVEAKRMILSIIRVQTGKNLLAILESKTSNDNEKIFKLQLETDKARDKDREEQLKRKGTIMEKSTHDWEGLGLGDLKKKALETLEKLEGWGKVSKANKYQDLLNDIAKDIRNKNRRRIQRRAELEKIQSTLDNLLAKTGFLEGQKESYNQYVQACMASMQDKSKKKDKRKSRAIPFTRQYHHMQELKKQGKEPKFGSFEYTAERLFEKGVLVSLEGVPEKQRSRVTITISSDEPGVFEVGGKFMGVTMESQEIRLEDLLQKQFDNIQYMSLFGTCKINVNLLIFLLNKKFFH